MMTVTKRMSFDAAHFLPGYQGKCLTMHGHTWFVDFTFRVDDPPFPGTGISVDFKHLKGACGKAIGRLDHSVLNDQLPKVSPSAENLAWYLMHQVKEFTKGYRAQLIRVRVYEGPNSWVDWEEW